MPPGHGWWGQLQPAAALDAERDQVRTEAARLLEVDPAEIVLVEHPRPQGIDIRAHWVPATSGEVSRGERRHPERDHLHVG